MAQKKQALLIQRLAAPSQTQLFFFTFKPVFGKSLFANANGANKSAGSKKRIMIADDEQDISMVFESGLRRKGFDVDVFNDPLQALDRFKPDYYDLVLLDVRMPGMNGFELWKELRKRDKRVKVCFISAFEIHEEELKKHLEDEEEQCIVRKPISMKELVGIINDRLSGSAQSGSSRSEDQNVMNKFKDAPN